MNVLQIFSSVCVAAAAVNLASSAIAEPAQAPKPLSDSELREFREKIEGHIQECIRKKTASPEVCRMTAYAAALAAGWPPEEAAQVTGYRPK